MIGDPVFEARCFRAAVTIWIVVLVILTALVVVA